MSVRVRVCTIEGRRKLVQLCGFEKTKSPNSVVGGTGKISPYNHLTYNLWMYICVCINISVYSI